MKAMPCGAQATFRFASFHDAVAKVMSKTSQIVAHGSMLLSALVLYRLQNGRDPPNVTHQDVWFMAFRCAVNEEKKFRAPSFHAFQPPKPSLNLKRMREASKQEAGSREKKQKLSNLEAKYLDKIQAKRDRKERERADRVSLHSDLKDVIAPLLKLPKIAADGYDHVLLDESRRAASNTLVSLKCTLFKRMKRCIKAQLWAVLNNEHKKAPKQSNKAVGILTQDIFRQLCRWDPVKRKDETIVFLRQAEWSCLHDALENIVLAHTARMPLFNGRLTDEGKMIDFRFLSYLYWIHSELDEANQRLFSILPQFKLKARFVTVSLNTLSVFFKEAGTRSLEWIPPDELKRMTYGKTRSKNKLFPLQVRTSAAMNKFFVKGSARAHAFWRHMFHIPKKALSSARLAKGWRLCTRLVTDGMSVRVFIENPSATSCEPRKGKKKKKGKETDEPRKTFALPKGTIVDAKDELTCGSDKKAAERRTAYVFVDPGHVDLMSCVRSVRSKQLCGPLRKEKNRSRRRFKRRMTEHQKGIRTFSVSNRHYRRLTYGKQSSQVLEKERRRTGMNGVYEELANCSHKVRTLEEYHLYVSTVIKWWYSLLEFAFAPVVRHLRFRRFQSTQSSGRTLVRSLRSALEIEASEKLVLVWGNGGFGPTSRGHASAPNKALVRRLLPHVHAVIYSTEHMSSRRCSRCQKTSLKEGKSGCAEKLRLRGLRHCVNCRSIWNRDTNAALNIRRMFWERVSEN